MHHTHTADQPTSEQRRTALLESQRRVLERIATGAPLEEVLLTLVRLIEEQARDMHCAVLLADAGQKRLRFVAAPHIPEDYRRGIEPYLRIAPDTGSCGTAAYLKQPVYTRDTANDPLWKKCAELAVRNGVRAIWSTPILGDDNRVLGTFAMYYGEPRLPAKEHIQLIDMAVQMARVAIEAKADEDLVRVAFDNTPRPLFITDIDGYIARANHAFAEPLGYNAAELRGKAIADIAEWDNAALVGDLLANEREVWSDRRYRTRDGRLLWAREQSTLRRDGGKPRYVVTYVKKLSDAADHPLTRLSRRERQVLELVVGGLTSKEIAARLRISAGSVDTYRSRIALKLGIDDLPGLVRFAIRHGIAAV
jgi:PAS domain S-box-containing protein